MKELPPCIQYISTMRSDKRRNGFMSVIVAPKLTYNLLRDSYRNIKDYRAGVIVRYNDSILLLHHKESGLWGFPKGHKDDGEEHPADTAIRELCEETSLETTIERFEKNIYVVEVTYKEGKDIHVYYMLNMTERPKVVVDNYEIDDYQWVTVTNIDNYNKSVPTIIAADAILNEKNGKNGNNRAKRATLSAGARCYEPRQKYPPQYVATLQ